MSKGEWEAQPEKEEKPGADEGMVTREEAPSRRKELWVLRLGENSVRMDNWPLVLARNKALMFLGETKRSFSGIVGTQVWLVGWSENGPQELEYGQLLSGASLLQGAKTSMIVKNVDMRLKEISFHFMKWSRYFFASKKRETVDIGEGEKCLP